MKMNVWWAILGLLMVAGLSGCGDEFAQSPDKCLANNEPWCSDTVSNGGDTGIGGNNTGDAGSTTGDGGAGGGTDSGSTTGDGGAGGGNDSGSGTDGGNTGYSCATDPTIGQSCLGGSGIMKCLPDGSGAFCEVIGGSGSDAGSGSADAGGSFPGAANCTAASTIALNLSSSTLLHSVKSDGTGYDAMATQVKVLGPGDRLIVAVQGNLTATVNVGNINVYKADSSPLFDITMCKLLGLSGPACTTDAIGDRTLAPYLLNVGKVENCRVHGTCDPALGGSVPNGSFTLFGVLKTAASLPSIPLGTVELVFDVPPACSP